MEKLLVICGPTATGKTNLALSLAKKFEGELVSADSKQVYAGLDIGTGKDIPPQSKRKGYYRFKGIKVWGYDLVDAKKSFSVSKYIDFACKRINSILKKGKLPILVGGTGLYIKAIVDGIETAKVPMNKPLRKTLEGKNTGELFELLAQLDPIRAGSMNSSDAKNPRRLVRAVEVATWKLQSPGKKLKAKRGYKEVLFVGLVAPREVLSERIKTRVDARVRAGLESEIKGLLERGVTWEDQSMSSLGYRQWREYFEKKSTREKTKEVWTKEEIKYAKRQIVWFKRDLRIRWFDITKPNWAEKVENLVKKWYKASESNGTKN